MPRLNLILVVLTCISLTACSSARSILQPNHISKGGTSGTFKVGNPYKIGGIRYVPQETYNFTQTGIASWYGPNFHGKLTANGEVYDQYALTAAHKTLQMPSLVRVTNLENGRSLIVRINDRGPFSRGRVIDMSKRGAELLKFKQQGTAKVKIQMLSKESRIIAEAAKQGIDISGVEIAMNEGRSIEDALNMPAYNRVQPQTAEPVKVASQPQEPLDLTKDQVPQAAAINPIESEPLTAPQLTAPQAPTIEPSTTPTSTSSQANFNANDLVQQVAVPPSNIFVQAGSFSSLENANNYVQSLSSFGKAAVYPAEVNNQTFYRVRLGPVGTVNEADTLLNSLTQAGQNQAIILVD